jgi:hypothetical protein
MFFTLLEYTQEIAFHINYSPMNSTKDEGIMAKTFNMYWPKTSLDNIFPRSKLPRAYISG